MKHCASPEFWAAYEKLPQQVRLLADRNFLLLKNDPGHPSVHLKKVGRYVSVRVGQQYRALAIEVDHRLLWFWIGTHAAYDRLVK